MSKKISRVRSAQVRFDNEAKALGFQSGLGHRVYRLYPRTAYQLHRRGTIKTPSWVAVRVPAKGALGEWVNGWESPVMQSAEAAVVYAKVCNWGQA